MSSWAKAVVLWLCAMVTTPWTLALPEGLDGLGRPATEGEVAAWDIDVRPDFVGLPPGSGDVWAGEEIWLAQCASCHGDFGDSNEIFAPLVLGNITEDDIATGRVASLTDPAVTRTTLMMVPTLSTLWDYIYRAMPWNAPKSLSPDEVYGLVAYLLNLGYVVDDDFVLSDTNMAETQARMPNRNGMSLDHGLWSVSGLPDVSGSSCTTDCNVSVNVASSLPAYAMNAHGNLAEQVRDWGPYPGLWTEPAAEPEQVAAASAYEFFRLVQYHGGRNPYLTWHGAYDMPIVMMSPVVKLHCRWLLMVQVHLTVMERSQLTAGILEMIIQVVIPQL